MKIKILTIFALMVIGMLAVFSRSNIPISRLDISSKVIPQPRQIIYEEKTCVLDDNWQVLVESTCDKTTRLSGELIVNDLKEIWKTNISLKIDDGLLGSSRKTIILAVAGRDKKIENIAIGQGLVLRPAVHPQGYLISINPDRDIGEIILLSNGSAGILYAAQTLRQLISKDKERGQIILPSGLIYDWPVFNYRGVHIQTAHPRPKPDYIRKILHLLSFYKINLLSMPLYFSDKEIEELINEANDYQITLLFDITSFSPENLQHQCRTKYCVHLDKKPVVWAGAALQEGRLIPKIPKKTIVLNTFISAKGGSAPPRRDTEMQGKVRIRPDVAKESYYDQIETFRTAGLEQILCVCPFQDGFIFPDISMSYDNIYNVTQAGIRHIEKDRQIMGLMISQRLDFIETVIAPIIWTAECAWSSERLDRKRFNNNLTSSLFGIRSSDADEIINLLSSGNELLGGYHNLEGSLYTDPFKSQIHLDIPNFYDNLHKIKSFSYLAQQKLTDLKQRVLRNEEILDVWEYHHKQWQIFVEQYLLSREIDRKYQRFVTNYLSSPTELNYPSIKKEFDEILDKMIENYQTYQNRYKEIYLQRYEPISEQDTVKQLISDVRTKKDNLAGVFELCTILEDLPQSEETGCALAKLPSRLTRPLIKNPSPYDIWIERPFIWWDSRWNYRVLVILESPSFRPVITQAKFGYPVEINLNFTQLLREGVHSISRTSITQPAFDPDSPRIVEYTVQGTPLREIAFQMDKSKEFDNLYNADVNLVWIIREPLLEKSLKYFYIYFDSVKEKKRPAPTVKYPDIGLELLKRKTYCWIENNRIKAQIKLTTDERPFLSNWIIKDLSTGLFSKLDLLSGAGGFMRFSAQNLPLTMAFAIEAEGSALVRIKAQSGQGHTYTFNFYENLGLCEVFTDTRFREYHNLYEIPEKYLNAPQTEYIFSNYIKGLLHLKQPVLSISEDETFYLTQKMAKGLVVAGITPDNRLTHYLTARRQKNGKVSISYGAEDKFSLIKVGQRVVSVSHFIVYADRTDLPDGTEVSSLMNQIRNLFAVERKPLIYRKHAETSLSR
jgi:hypothetical protein